MNNEQILDFLLRNPQFFEENAEVISEINIPHPYSGRAISLNERQLLSLREANRNLEQKLAILMRFGERNDKTSERLHRLAVSLIRCENFLRINTSAITALRDDFSIDYPVLRLWGPLFPHGDGQIVLISDIAKANIMRLKAPTCGPVENGDPSIYGDEDAAKVRSQALIPLRAANGSDSFGVVALGSASIGHFERDMENLYLIRLGELLSAALLSIATS